MTPDQWRRYAEKNPDLALTYERAGLRWEDIQICACCGVVPELNETQEEAVRQYESYLAPSKTCELIRCLARETEHRLADPDRYTKDSFLLPYEQTSTSCESNGYILHYMLKNNLEFSFLYGNPKKQTKKYADTPSTCELYRLSSLPGEILWGFFANVDVPSFTLRYVIESNSEEILKETDLAREVRLERGMFVYAFRDRYPLSYMGSDYGSYFINTSDVTPVYVVLSKPRQRRYLSRNPIVMGDEAAIGWDVFFFLTEEDRQKIRDLLRKGVVRVTHLCPLRDPYTVRDACRAIQQAWRVCISDPKYAVCRRRLAREFDALVASETP